MSSSSEHQCKCSGSKKIDSNAITLQEATVDFLKVQQGDCIHYCLDGIDLTTEQIVYNVDIAYKMLQKNDHMVISSKQSILHKLQLPNNLTINECILEDNNFYTVIFN